MSKDCDAVTWRRGLEDGGIVCLASSGGGWAAMFGWRRAWPVMAGCLQEGRKWSSPMSPW